MVTTTKATTDQAVIQQLKAMGLSDTIIEDPYRLIVSIAGHEKVGKTHWALTAPDPIFFINMDDGIEGVIERFQRSGKKIYVYTVRVQRGEGQARYKAIWDSVKGVLLKCCETGKGTIIIDTASELYELARLAHFGKLDQVMPHHYSQVNAEWQKDILSAFYDSAMNVIMVHRVKAVYVNNVRTKDYDMSGFTDTGYKVQVKLTAFRETYLDDNDDSQLRFGITVDDCRKRAYLIGQEFRMVQPLDPKKDLQIDPVVNFQFLLDLIHGG